MTAVHESTVSIRLDVTPTLSYAMAHNEVSVIHRVVVDGVPSSVRGAQLRLQLRDATGPVGGPHDIAVDLEAGTPTVLTDVKPALDAAAMLQLEEQRRIAAGMPVRELHREVLNAFGFRRLTSGIEQRLDSAVDLGVKIGRLRVERDGMVHPN